MSMTPSRGKPLLALLFFLFVTWSAAIVGMAASRNEPVIYAKIVQPSWAPPSWVFGPVWTTLYGLMAVAAWRVWMRRGLRGPATVYLIHLIFQSMWSWLFFGLGRADLAMIDMLILLWMIVTLLMAFRRIDRLAGGLMLPYLLWVGFATVLNGALWLMNGGILPR